jgi:hypothetical protein
MKMRSGLGVAKREAARLGSRTLRHILNIISLPFQNLETAAADSRQQIVSYFGRFSWPVDERRGRNRKSAFQLLYEFPSDAIGTVWQTATSYDLSAFSFSVASMSARSLHFDIEISHHFLLLPLI